MSEKKNGNAPGLDEIDDFWDLESLLPQKRPVNLRREINTDTVELHIGVKSSSGGVPIPPREKKPEPVTLPRRDGAYSKTLSGEPRDAAPPPSPRDEARRLRELSMKVRAKQNEPQPLEPYLAYEPSGGLIKKVSVSKWQTSYRFYERFRSDAHRLWERTASECPHVQFFSYVPQYNQLSYAQMKWYFYWRSEIRKKHYPRTDYSYILLYIYEIINCPELVEPSVGIGLLCDIWLGYRGLYPRIDSYLAEWVCDYCLVNQLPCPSERLARISSDIVAAASFKEFYMVPSDDIDSASWILSYSSNYDWRTSRYVTEENIAVFSKHIGRAFELVCREILSKDESWQTSATGIAELRRDAYSGALCVYDMKRSIAIEYLPCTRSIKFRFIVTDTIKYCENRVRMALGIKSRLKTEALTPEIRRLVDEYFDRELPPRKAGGKTRISNQPREESYEQLYEPLHETFSLERALDIERSSWNTTEKLTNMFDEAPAENTVDGQSESTAKQQRAKTDSTIHEPSESTASESGATAEAIVKTDNFSVLTAQTSERLADDAESSDGDDDFIKLIRSLDGVSVKALTLLASGDASGIRSAAAENGMLADALADRINEAAFDIIGDSVVEQCGDGYRLIDDYEGDIKRCLK